MPKTATAAPRDARLNLRITTADYRLIEAAAARQRMTLSDFCRGALEDAATETLAGAQQENGQ